MPLREHAFQYVECDIPQGVTLDRWRVDRAAETEPRRRLVRLPALRVGRRRDAAHPRHAG